ncbi:MAG: SPOR domain-containing protein [Gammaproteobacteria bacterium]|nr:SPOR domain-containing protein [Gammaproteobacteria bacterium]MBU1482656.1 SPOR domain-containing protein [Gammaproteobacteria bacterium]
MSNGKADKGKVIAGVFIGMVLGIVAAGAVAWYVIEKKSTAFINKEHKSAAPVAPLAVNAPAAPGAASGVAETKQHFEFYKVLTDKPDNTSRNNARSKNAGAKPQITPSPATEMYFVQAGSFQNVGDAEKLKAKLAFSGFEASIQTANIPDKGVWYRVRLGPYNNGDAGKTIVALRQNGIVATQVQTQ